MKLEILNLRDFVPDVCIALGKERKLPALVE